MRHYGANFGPQDKKKTTGNMLVIALDYKPHHRSKGYSSLKPFAQSVKGVPSRAMQRIQIVLRLAVFLSGDSGQSTQTTLQE